MAADQKYSAGARFERKAMREYLERKVQRGGVLESAYIATLHWVKGRQSRYDKKPGGL
jgi:hypothetical protein